MDRSRLTNLDRSRFEKERTQSFLLANKNKHSSSSSSSCVCLHQKCQSVSQSLICISTDPTAVFQTSTYRGFIFSVCSVAEAKVSEEANEKSGPRNTMV